VTPTKAWLYLAVAIVAEVIATSSLKASASFTRTAPAVIVVAGYGVAFYCLSRSLEVLPVGITYAVWSGVGIVLVTLIAWFLYRQTLDLPALLGLALIIAGVLVLNLWSKSVPH
jgi:small multidrug resistance pump